MDVYRQVKVEKILNNPTIGQKNSPSYGKGFVPTTGFEPARPYEHHPLKMASLPISPRGLENLN
jgi:hypothetical protein